MGFPHSVRGHKKLHPWAACSQVRPNTSSRAHASARVLWAGCCQKVAKVRHCDFGGRKKASAEDRSPAHSLMPQASSCCAVLFMLYLITTIPAFGQIAGLIMMTEQHSHAWQAH